MTIPLKQVTVPERMAAMGRKVCLVIDFADDGPNGSWKHTQKKPHAPRGMGLA